MAAWANPGVAERADNNAAAAMALRDVARILALERTLSMVVMEGFFYIAYDLFVCDA